MKTFFWILTIAGVAVGALVFVAGMLSANDAPQEAAIAATSLTIAALPYILARAVTELGNKK